MASGFLPDSGAPSASGNDHQVCGSMQIRAEEASQLSMQRAEKQGSVGIMGGSVGGEQGSKEDGAMGLVQ